MGSGTGWKDDEGTQWFYYNQTNTDWWNQWFYDDPPSDERWKHVEYDMDLDVNTWQDATEYSGLVEIALNWSTLGWSSPVGLGPDGSPPMPEDEAFIEREVIYSELIDIHWGSLSKSSVEGTFDILTHNPEWVSIDFRVDNAFQALDIPEDPDPFPMWDELEIELSGTIKHECVPEPSTLAICSVVGLTGIAVTWRRRRRKGA